MSLKHKLLVSSQIILLSYCTIACAEQKKVVYTEPVLADVGNINDVSGFLPETVHLRTMTQSYCKYYDFVLVDGRIYARKAGEDKWKLFLKTGLPFSTTKKDAFDTPFAIRYIAADGDTLYAFDDQGYLYYCFLVRWGNPKPLKWMKLYGFPKTRTLKLNDLVLNARGWSMGQRRKDILYHTDINGNPHHYGTMGLETMYFLTEDGQHIRFTDSGMPPDFSNSIDCPKKGRFIAENISVSGDTIFLIGNKGSMYTRLIDFDTMGCDPMFFLYTYDKVEQKYSGEEYLSNYSPWALPAEDWYEQPAIPLSGDARLTRMISIAQTGRGNDARELRVAGTNAAGEIGYYHKMLKEEVWNFTKVDLKLDSSVYLNPDKGEDGEDVTFSYSGYLAKNGNTVEGVSFLVEDVSLDSTEKINLTVTYTPPAKEGEEPAEETFKALLHAVEKWTYMQRYNPGFDGTAKNFFITLEFETPDLSLYSPEFRDLIEDMFIGRHHKLFALSAEATDSFFQLDIEGQKTTFPFEKNNYLAFMAKGGNVKTISPLAYKGFMAFENPILNKLTEDDLVLKAGVTYTIKDRTAVQKRIDLNEAYKKQLKEEIKHYDSLKSKTDVSRWGYSAIDLLTKITFLNHLNFPKIKQMTSFGSNLMNSNANNFAEIAGYNGWSYSNVLDLVEIRLSEYKKIIDSFDNNNIEEVLDANIRDSYPEYYDMIGLPVEAVSYSENGELNGVMQRLRSLTYFPGYFVEIKDGYSLVVMLKDSAKVILKEMQDGKLDNIKFDAEFVTISMTHDKDSLLKDSHFKRDEYREGHLEWDGKTIKLYAKNSLLGETLIFEGKSAQEEAMTKFSSIYF